MYTKPLFILLICFTGCFALHPARDKVFNTTADTYLSKNQPDVNFGSDAFTLIGEEPVGNKYNTLVKFDTAPPACNVSLPSKQDPCYTEGVMPSIDQILFASLAFDVEQVFSHNNKSVIVQLLAASDFNESTANWNDSTDTIRPLVDEVELALNATELLFDITQAVQAGYNNFMLRVKGSGVRSLVRLSSRESGFGAELKVHEAAVELVAPETGCEDLFMMVENLNISYTDCPYSGTRTDYPEFVWLHGAPTNKDLWRNQHQWVQPVGRSIAASMPGSGLSDDVDLANGTKSIIAESSRIMKLFVQQLDLQRMNCIGQDFGDGVCRMIERDLANEGQAARVDGIWSIEGTMISSITCSPEEEAEGICSADGGFGGIDSFVQQCYSEDMSVIPNNTDPELKCGTYMLTKNWFYNSSLYSDPNVRNQSAPGILPGELMPVSPFLLAYPFPGSEDVINTLTFDFQPSELANQVYQKAKLLAMDEPPQVLQNWPRTLVTNGGSDNVNSAPFRQLIHDTRVAYESGGVFENNEKFYFRVSPSIANNTRTRGMIWAETYYKNFITAIISRAGMHYYTEDNTGAQDMGLFMRNWFM